MAGYIFGGAAISGASAAAGMGVGIAVGGALATAGVKGILGGAITGAVSGIVAGTISGLGMGLLTGKTGNDLWKSTWQGALIGMGSGMVMGATIGMLDALANNKNVWLGRDIAMGRNAWSLNNTDKPAKYFFTASKEANVYRIDAWSEYLKSITEKNVSNYETVKSNLENWIGKGFPKKTVNVENMIGRGFLDYSGYVEQGCTLQINFDGKNVLNLSPGYHPQNRLVVPSGVKYIDIELVGTPYYYGFDNWPTVPFKSVIQGVWKY